MCVIGYRRVRVIAIALLIRNKIHLLVISILETNKIDVFLCDETDKPNSSLGLIFHCSNISDISMLITRAVNSKMMI